MDIERFNKIISENKYWIFLGIIFIIISYLQLSYGVITSAYNYFFPEPIYIIKSRIETTNKDIISELNKQNYVLIGSLLIDECGSMINVVSFAPKYKHKFVKTSADFLRIGQQNLTYSISLLTEEKIGNIPLYIYSYSTKFSIEKRVVSVKEVGESKNVEGLYEKRVDIVLSTYFQKHQALFDIIPEKEGKITIECLGIKNCKIIETRYIIWDIPPADYMQFLAYYPNGTPFLFDVKLPRPNFNKVTVYELDTINKKLIEVSTDTQTGYYIYFSPPPSCVKEGKIYLNLSSL